MKSGNLLSLFGVMVLLFAVSNPVYTSRGIDKLGQEPGVESGKSLKELNKRAADEKKKIREELKNDLRALDRGDLIKNPKALSILAKYREKSITPLQAEQMFEAAGLKDDGVLASLGKTPPPAYGVLDKNGTPGYSGLKAARVSREGKGTIIEVENVLTFPDVQTISFPVTLAEKSPDKANLLIDKAREAGKEVALFKAPDHKPNITDPQILARIEKQEIEIITVDPTSPAGLQLKEVFKNAAIVGLVEDLNQIKTSVQQGEGLN